MYAASCVSVETALSASTACESGSQSLIWRRPSGS